MTRYAIYLSLLLIPATPSALLGASETTSAKAKPNIVLILADDLGINDLGCYGRGEHKTPHLDALARAGVRFTCAYAAQPICSPSRAAIMTGKSPARLHLTTYLPGRPDCASQKLLQPRINQHLPLEEVTIAERLGDGGYVTGIFGKWHLGDGRFEPEAQGFDVVDVPRANSDRHSSEGAKQEIRITGAAEEFIESNQSRPFFCFVAHHNPHIPLAAAPEITEKYAGTFNPEYAAMIETLDTSVGRLLRKLDELHLSDNTLVIFTSDNGGLHVLEAPGTPATANEPFRAGKGYVYEGGLRVPLIVRLPKGGATNRNCSTPVVLTDLFPTLLAAAGIDDAQTAPRDGENLLPVLQGQEIPDRALFWHFPHYSNQGGRPAGAIRKGNWKLIEHYEDGSVELFDLEQDPGETSNRADAEPTIVAELQKDLHTWLSDARAQMPTENPQFDEALHRELYLERDPSKLEHDRPAAAIERDWKDWRDKMRSASRAARRGDS